MDWIEPWQLLDQAAHVASFEAELNREVSPGHPLYGLCLRAVGRRPDRDDALFAIEDGSGRVAQVNLTWLGAEERLPCPVVRIYNNVAARVAGQGRRSAR
jgi:hypothetical protein